MQILTRSDNQVSVHLKNSLDTSHPIQIAEFDLCECSGQPLSEMPVPVVIRRRQRT